MEPPLGNLYRVLDLADEKGMFCGQILAGLGADVIKVEKPGGDRTRNIGPFYHNIPHPEKSLYWFFHNLNKRGITLELENKDGLRLFKKLAARTDFIIESFHPGYLGSLGLGYQELSQINPKLIMISITPFGQTGPYRDYEADDLVSQAMGGYMTFMGDEDRPPIRITVPQSYLHASGCAAVAALIALYYRHSSGEGQHIDVSLEDVVIRALFTEPWEWELNHFLVTRAGPRVRRQSMTSRQVWDCKDGQVGYRIILGPYSKSLRGVAELMKEEGIPLGPFANMDWNNLDYSKLDQGIMNEWEKTVSAYFMKHTKAELFEKSKEKRLYLAPSYDARELTEFEQLKARGVWVGIEHEELGETITYFGPPVKLSLTPWQMKRRAPLIGEHNQEVYQGELGLTPQELTWLKTGGAI
ncbi:CaiB/BaiF CoA transferase family protein [Chloroflexota bacterium]